MLRQLSRTYYFIYYNYTVSCQEQPVITNGLVDCSKGADGISHFQDSCQITCNPGYTMPNSNTATCLSNGTWSSTVVECIRGMSQVFITDGIDKEYFITTY